MSDASPISLRVTGHLAAFLQFAEGLFDRLLGRRSFAPPPALLNAESQCDQALDSLARSFAVVEVDLRTVLILGEVFSNPRDLHNLVWRQTVNNVIDMGSDSLCPASDQPLNACRDGKQYCDGSRGVGPRRRHQDNCRGVEHKMVIGTTTWNVPLIAVPGEESARYRLPSMKFLR